jgi:hypothetical protein
LSPARPTFTDKALNAAGPAFRSGNGRNTRCDQSDYRIRVPIALRRGSGVTDVDVVIAFLVTRIIRESRPGFGGTDAGSSQEVDSALGMLSRFVEAKLGAEPVLDRMRNEVRETTALRPRTRTRVALALEDAIEGDPGFAGDLQGAVATLQHLASETTAIPNDASESVVNQITGNVYGRVVQARDIHGDISF